MTHQIKAPPGIETLGQHFLGSYLGLSGPWAENSDGGKNL